MSRMFGNSLIILLVLSLFSGSYAQKKSKAAGNAMVTAKSLSGLKLRTIGPALTSGRIGDIAVRADKPSHYYVAVASGGVWKTENSGTTWKSIFDSQGSYSIGCVMLDPNNHQVVWVGTGENNSQRSVGYGDGVYKSLDGGKSWKNMGLKASEHIGMIRIDPRDSDVVFVASQGPLWSDGGDRGLYKSTDGGKTWRNVLSIDQYTGVSEVHFDPRDPDVLYASAYQRRRHVWTLINGGPGSAIYKSTDNGETWREVTSGLPNDKMGRIGMAVAPSNPDIVYAIIEAKGKSSGFYRSIDRGESWHKQGSYVSGSPQYYQEIYVDPHDPDRIYSMDTWMNVSNDGGKTFKRIGERYKHVDNHALWIDPDDTDYLLAGCDGGVYESFDRGKTWNFKANLPITQFYKITADNDAPFYNVYGGTQDNFTLGAPSRTTTVHGIMNSDWVITLGGDGFKPQVDPKDPNIVYSQYQYGGLARFDKASGERVYIQPQPGKGEPALRWNWDSALLISPHSNTRLYYGSNILFRSDDRGNSWKAVSPDLTRQMDRNKLPVMGRVQTIDAVAKNRSTSFYGTIVALSESSLREGLLYVGTDDGLVQISEDGGRNWRKISRIKDVPDRTYVNCLLASQHDENVVYGAFNNHKMGDFKPYLMKSRDRGATWTSIAGDLPDRGSVYVVVEDHENPNLLFAGTEFGLFTSVNGGKNWIQLKSGLPTIAVRDLEIQKRENDLVVGTFGRGIYILDDYTPLREMAAAKSNNAQVFPVKKAMMYIQDLPLGLRGKGFLGDGFYVAENPAFGAQISYYLPKALKTLKQQREAREKEIIKEGGTPPYPDWDTLRRERRELKPSVTITIKDDAGNVVRRLKGKTSAGLHRLTWDLRYPASNPTRLGSSGSDNPFRSNPVGPLVVPGNFTVSMSQTVEGVTTELGEPQALTVETLGLATLAAEDKAALLAFQKKAASLQRAVLGSQRVASDMQNRLNHIRAALMDTPGADPALTDEANGIETALKDLLVKLNGDRLISSFSEPAAPGISGRVGRIMSGLASTADATGTHRDNYRIAAEEFTEVLAGLTKIVDVDLKALEAKLEKAGAPWTPGRLPIWKME